MKASSEKAPLTTAQKMSPAFFTPISSDRRMVAMTLSVLEAVAAARPRPRLPVRLLINRNRPVLNLVQEKFCSRLFERADGSCLPRKSNGSQPD